MPEITFKESIEILRTERQKLELNIAQLLSEFTQHTGVYISAIMLDQDLMKPKVTLDL